MQKAIELKILKELEEFIIPIEKDQFLQLETNIIQEGCRESLIVWETKDKLVLVDGHNRYAICQQHGIDFEIEKFQFKNLNEVKLWMIDNQLGRRNLNPDQLSYYRGLKYQNIKKKRGGYEQANGEDLLNSADELSKTFGVSPSTIKRDGKFAEAIDLIGKGNSGLKKQILTGKSKVKKTDILLILRSKNKISKIKNEADLFNKARVIEKELMDETQNAIDNLTVREEMANEPELQPDLFPAKEDRIKNLKGLVISAMNRAISNKDFEAMREIRELIQKMEDILFD